MKNTIIISLITFTGIMFTCAIFFPFSGFHFLGLGVVAGWSAVMTKLLVKDT